MDLELIRLLADDGTPLEVRVEQGEGEAWVSRPLKGAHLVREDGVLEKLRHALRHYPREAVINGEAVETSPAPRESVVELGEHDGRNLLTCRFRRLHPREEPEDPFRIIAGGVGIAAVPAAGNAGPEEELTHQSRYVTLAEGSGARHRRPLSILRTTTALEVRAHELGGLEMKDGSVRIRPGSLLDDMTRERRRETEERTLALTGIPPVFRGAVYGYPISGERGDPRRWTPAPMAVKGTPVTIR